MHQSIRQKSPLAPDLMILAWKVDPQGTERLLLDQVVPSLEENVLPSIIWFKGAWLTMARSDPSRVVVGLQQMGG